MTPAFWWEWGEEEKTCGNGTDTETKTVRKQGRGRNVEGNNTVWTFLFTHMDNTTLSSGLLSTPVRDVHVHQTFDWLPGSHEDKHQTDILPGFSFACFSMSGGKRDSGEFFLGMLGIKEGEGNA